MKNIAIIAPCILPVPASKGGAVEELVTRIILDNEKVSDLKIDLYTIEDENVDYSSLKNTNIIYIKSNRITGLLDRAIDKFYRTLRDKSAKRILDSKILDVFCHKLSESETRYDAVIVENMMSTALSIVSYISGKYDFPVFFHMHNDVNIYRSP